MFQNPNQTYQPLNDYPSNPPSGGQSFGGPSYHSEPEYGYQTPATPTTTSYSTFDSSQQTKASEAANVNVEGQEPLDEKAMMRRTYIPKMQALFGEFFGTCILVGVGCGTASVEGSGLIGIAISFGFILMSLVQSFVPISGGHFNPIITMCMCMSQRMTPLLGVGYFIAQVLGGLVGAGIIKACVPYEASIGATKLSDDMSPGRGFLLEAWMTSVLIFTVYSTAVSSRAHKKLAPLPIAVALTSLIILGGDKTGGSMNPARSFGPAVVSGQWADHWIYWIGPVVGGFVGWVFYQITHFQPK